MLEIYVPQHHSRSVELPRELMYILQRRRELGLTQSKLAEMAGVSQAYVSRLEKGRLDPRLSTVRRILKVLEEGRKPKTILRKVMSRPVIGAAPEETVSRAVKRMAEYGFSQLPVLQKGTPLGSVSERSIMREMAEAKNPAAIGLMRILEVMEPVPPTLPPEAEVSQALSLLDAYSMVLVMEKGVVTGIVTRADILRMIDRAFK